MLKNIMRSTLMRRTCGFVAMSALTMVLLGAQSPNSKSNDGAVPAEAYLDGIVVDGFVIPSPLDEPEGADYPGIVLYVEEAGEDEGHVDGFVYLASIPMSYELQRYTWERCEELGLEYPLVLAIMWRESRFQSDIVHVNSNGTRDSGIMQINDVNRDWLRRDHGIVDLMDPVQNINAGTAMLAGFMDKYGENHALMAYQYGEQGMLSRAQRGVTTNDLTRVVQSKRDEFAAALQAAAEAEE